MNRARNRALLTWYDRNRRDLPWRWSSDPYAVLVSELMAQQTQISRVVPFYERFMARFPTVEALAGAPLAEVLAAWSGLGYNRRARYLKEAATHVAEHGWPETAESLQALPGVGPYTAAAVACFAFGEPVAAVDTNLRRVLSRWHGRELTGADLGATAAGDLDAKRAADWNQAVMDLGAQLCAPRTPQCAPCPVKEWCADPTIYTPPPGQPAFNGSSRQARGAILKSLVTTGRASKSDLVARTRIDPTRIQAALEDLHTEAMITHDEGGWSLVTGQ